MRRSVEVEIKDKILLTIEEASALTNIGTNRLRENAAKPGCPYVVKVGEIGGRVLINKSKFIKFLDTAETF